MHEKRFSEYLKNLEENPEADNFWEKNPDPDLEHVHRSLNIYQKYFRVFSKLAVRRKSVMGIALTHQQREFTREMGIKLYASSDFRIFVEIPELPKS